MRRQGPLRYKSCDMLLLLRIYRQIRSVKDHLSHKVTHCLFAPDNHIDRVQRLSDRVERHVLREGESSKRVPSYIRFIV
jgi:hypothetical protein